MSTVHSIDKHPDILALRAGYERASEPLIAQGVFGLMMLVAVYAVASPWIVGFDAATRLTINDLIVGIAVAVLAVGFSSALDRAHGLTWTLPVLGVWQIISTWILTGASPSAGMVWSNVVSGAVITLLGLIALYFGLRARDLTAR